MFCAPSGVDIICPPLRAEIEIKSYLISLKVGRKKYRVLWAGFKFFVYERASPISSSISICNFTLAFNALKTFVIVEIVALLAPLSSLEI